MAMGINILEALEYVRTRCTHALTGFNTGNVEKLNNSQAESDQATCLPLSISGVESCELTLYGNSQAGLSSKRNHASII